MAMHTDHDVFLDRVLPHVNPRVIIEAQQAITELDWDDSDSADLYHHHHDDDEDDEEDDDDEEEPYRSATPRSRSVITRTDSTSDISFTAPSDLRSGGLSPARNAARRHTTFANFDSSVVEEMAEGDERQMAKPANGGAVQQTIYIEPTELPRKPAPRVSQVAAPETGSPRPSRSHAGSLTSVDVPFRYSSKGASGEHYKNDEAAESGRARGPTILEEDARGEDDGSEDDNDHVPKASSKLSGAKSPAPPAPPEPSSTPPPILGARPNRMVMYDDFVGENDLDDDTNGEYEGHDPRLGPGFSSIPYHEEAQRPPQVYRNKERRLHSMRSDGLRNPHEMQYSRSAAPLTSRRDPRTPMLSQAQLYQEVERKRSRPDRSIDDRLQPQPPRKPYRSLDGGMYNGYTAGVTAGAAGGQEYSRGMSLRHTYSDDEVSVRHQSISGRTAASTTSQSMPDFFSSSIFQVVLHNPTTAFQLLKFSETRLCAENVEFLTKVDEYRTTLNNLASQMAGIHKTFISPGSQSQINVNGALLNRAHKDMKALINRAFPSMEMVFTDLQEQIETMVFQDIYPRFVRHQMALSAARALGVDRFKYQGLGDCFCLTNPNVADNPIVFASDGFVKVTGYTRPEIIPRNCRFLQGSYTDRQPVQRLKQAIAEKKESVELLLNYKKNGDPFWNLLYVAPLYNAKGRTEFFIGGQVNCSTTIHSNVDVMKVLSMSGEAEQDNESLKIGPLPASKPSARRTFLKALGVRQEGAAPVLPTGDAGMEKNVLGRMEGQDLSMQMKEFYTAYSKYLVVRASSFTVEFYSEGVVDALNPANLAGITVAGSDVFRFLGANMLAKQSDYKLRVRNAVRAGLPVSTALRLQTRRSAQFRGDESFMAHWTPLKDDKAMVHWIVVTLAPMVW